MMIFKANPQGFAFIIYMILCIMEIKLFIHDWMSYKENSNF